MQKGLNRRSFLGRSASVLGTALLPANTFAASFKDYEAGRPASGQLDEFALAYLKTMHAPGMTVGLVSGEQATTHAYGRGSLESGIAVDAAQPFWIGSICKSFVGIVTMQLRDEGKLDLHKPVRDIMPDLPFIDDFGKITTHHLLTHTSGLPNWLQLFASNPARRAKQAYAPGERFAYCNLGYDTLGFLIEHLDGRSWPDSVTARILKPLGMNHSSAQIDDAVQSQMPTGYQFMYRDRPCTVVDPLVAVGYVTMSNAAGSIAAPAADMCKYMRMLTQRGHGPSGRIVSEEGFKLFSTPYVKAPVLSPTSSYGYGIGVDSIDGRTMLRHTGGATAFASSILVDLDSGVGAFASINAMQGFRPNPVTRFAVDLMYNKQSGLGTPSLHAIEDPLAIKQPEAFSGRYWIAGGERLMVSVVDTELTITTSLGTTTLRPLGGDMFSAADDSILASNGRPHTPSAFAVFFEREQKEGSTPGPVTGLAYGSRWYASEHDSGGTSSTTMLETAGRYIGSYASDSPWFDLIKVVERKEKLWLDGVGEMHSIKEHIFSVEGGEGSLELEFVSFLNGRAQMVEVAGTSLRRVALAAFI